jgi:hypothetical protein
MPIRSFRRSLAVFMGFLVALAVLPVSPVQALPPAASYTLSVLAGDGNCCTPVPGPATSSSLYYVDDTAVDSTGNVYITSNAGYNSARILKVDTSGNLSIFAGNGTSGAPVPGSALLSPLSYITGLAVDASDNLYFISGTQSAVGKIDTSGNLSMVAGGSFGAITPGPAINSLLGLPERLVFDGAGNLYISDSYYDQILKINTSGALSIVAGDGTSGAPTPGPATSSKLAKPKGLGVDGAGNLYIADEDNNMILKVTTSGTLSIVAGTGTDGAPTPGPATSSALSKPAGVAADAAGNVFIADTYNHLILKVDTSGDLSILAGLGYNSSPTPGPATSSAVGYPKSIQIDGSGNLYVSVPFQAVKLAVPVTAPAAPTSLVATAGDGSASIAFTAGADGGAEITKYQVKVGNGSWTDAVGTTSPITVTGLTNYQTARIRLRAVNSAGDGDASATVTVRPRLASSSLTSVKAQSATRIQAVFAALTPLGGTVSHYWVYAYAKNTNTVVSSCRSSAVARSCVVKPLTANTEYDIAVRGFFRLTGSPTVLSTLDSAKQTVRTKN